jgi:hypothetical protein
LSVIFNLLFLFFFVQKCNHIFEHNLELYLKVLNLAKFLASVKTKCYADVFLGLTIFSA